MNTLEKFDLLATQSVYFGQRATVGVAAAMVALMIQWQTMRSASIFHRLNWAVSLNTDVT